LALRRIIREKVNQQHRNIVAFHSLSPGAIEQLIALTVAALLAVYLLQITDIRLV
jgi:hypothetical protein